MGWRVAKGAEVEPLINGFSTFCDCKGSEYTHSREERKDGK